MNIQKKFLTALLGITIISYNVALGAEVSSANSELSRAYVHLFNCKLQLLLEEKKDSAADASTVQRLFFNMVYHATDLDELGILDEILDNYFKKTNLTPNSTLADKNNNSFLSLMAFGSAVVDDKNSEIIFDKLLQRGGDPKLVITDQGGKKSSTIDMLENECKFYCDSAREISNETTKAHCEKKCTHLKRMVEKCRNQ